MSLMTTHKECLAHFVHFALSEASGYKAPSHFGLSGITLWFLVCAKLCKKLSDQTM